MSASLCVLAFLAALAAGWLSLADGVGVVVAVGYVFGIARANLLDTPSYFLFDSAVAGLYVAAAVHLVRPQARPRYHSLRLWLGLLIGWPLIMLAVPLQDFLIQLVGLRGNVYLLPLIAVGTQFDARRVDRLALWMSALNLAALGLAAAEFRYGIEPFFPESPVTELMYRSKDVAGFTAYRIPAGFVNAHAYGGTMVRTLPWLLAAWVRPDQPPWRRGAVLAGIVAAALGVFLSSTRSPALVLFIVLAVFSVSPEVRGWFRLTWGAVLGGLLYAVSSSDRLQRFTQLADVTAVTDRVTGSVNATFFELLTSYPMGNGLGGGGTSIPAFLQDRLRQPVGLESEYSRILMELGVIGLGLWLGFLGWLAVRVVTTGHWLRSLAVRLAAVVVVCDLTQGLIGIGLMTSIPGSALLMVYLGYLARDLPPPERRP